MIYSTNVVKIDENFDKITKLKDLEKMTLEDFTK